jgi:hypothetical protein
LGLAPFAAFWPLGAPFFSVAPFFEEAFSGADCALVPRLFWPIMDGNGSDSFLFRDRDITGIIWRDAGSSKSPGYRLIRPSRGPARSRRLGGYHSLRYRVIRLLATLRDNYHMASQEKMKGGI